MRSKGFFQYLVGALFICLAIYQIYRDELWEFAMYGVAGAAFISIGLIKDNKFERYSKLLNIVSWILILTAGFLLIFLLRTDE